MAPIFKKTAKPADPQKVGSLASAPARLAGTAVLAMQTDDRLVALAREGHERAFEVIVDRYRRPLIRYCGRVLPASRAEDAVQQAFLNAHTALMRSDEAVELKPWLYKIAHNASLNLLRQNGWNYEQIPLDFDGVRRPDQVVEQRIELQDTVAAVKDLPERQRSALVMRELEGRSYAEIAALLGAGDGAVRQLLNRARVTLRSAATAVTPPPLVLRVVETTPRGGHGTRIAEAIGGMGSAGLAKAGVTALVAGSLVVGAAKAPLPVVGNQGAKHEAVAKPAGSSVGGEPVAVPVGTLVAAHGKAERGAGRSNPAHGHAQAKRNSSGRRHAATRDDSSGHGERRGSGDDHSGRSGSGSGGDDRTRTDERSGSGRSGTDGGSDDTVAQAPTDNSGPGGGSDDGLSGDSSSSSLPESPTVTSPDNSGPGSTTSGDSGTSGSDGSGSGTSGSGSPSDDSLSH